MDWLCICTGGLMVKLKIEQYGYCSKTGKCLNPFGARPLWVIKLAEKIRRNEVVTNTQEALF